MANTRSDALAATSHWSHLKMELRESTGIFARWWWRALVTLTLLWTAGMLVAIAIDEHTRLEPGEWAVTALLLPLVGVVLATVPAALVGGAAVVLRIAGAWIALPLIAAPLSGSFTLWVGWELVEQTAAWALGDLSGTGGHGHLILLPIVLVCLIPPALLAVALLVIGAAIGLAFTAPPLLFGIVRRTKRRSAQRARA